MPIRRCLDPENLLDHQTESVAVHGQPILRAVSTSEAHSFGQRLQGITVLRHDVVNELHRRLKIGVNPADEKAVRRLGQSEVVSLLQAETLLRQDETSQVADLLEFELHGVASGHVIQNAKHARSGL